MNAQYKKHHHSSPDLWLIHANSDLRMARMAVDHDVLPEQICFHEQQAEEKALKAVLLFAGIDFPYSHDLEGLLDTLEEAQINVPKAVKDVGVLTPYAVETRYPGFWEDISAHDVLEALTLAEQTITWAEIFIRSVGK
jgi:HEPN domain-containing protein